MAYNVLKGAVEGSVDQYADQQIEGTKIFKNTISASVFYDTDAQSPCATIKDVASNEEYKEFLFNKNAKNFGSIKYTYDGKSQQFTLTFKYKLLGINVSIPITSRTRAQGGWSGKSLYINTPGIKVK